MGFIRDVVRDVVRDCVRDIDGIGELFPATVELLLTSNGDGVARAGFTVSEDITITLGANAKFYSDASGTLDESSTWNVIAGANRTMYVKCTTGTATFTFSDGRKVTNWAIGSGNGWVSLTTAPSISGDISGLTSLTYVGVEGSNTLSGSVAGLTSLTYFRVTGSNTLSGDISGLKSLTYVGAYGSNTLSGDISGLKSLTVLIAYGSNTLSGNISGLTSLTYVAATGLNTLSGDVSELKSLTVLYVCGLNTLSGDINPIVNGIINLLLNPCAMDTYTAGATWSNAPVTIKPSVGYGYDSTEIDNILIDMAASNIFSGKTITLQGSSLARTSASDAAVLKLETLNSGYVHAVNTIVTNP